MFSFFYHLNYLAQAPSLNEVTFESLQAVQLLAYVTHWIDGQGAFTHLTPVSFLAHTGLYSRVHIWGLGSLHGVEFENAFVAEGWA